MNSVRSTWIGWGALCVVGGAAYYLAKQSIIADRANRYEEERKRALQAADAVERRREAAVRNSQAPSPADDSSLKRANMTRFQSAADDVASPSSEGSHDPAPTRHEPETEEERILEKSKYETAVPYRPPKGNRLS